MQMFYFFFSNYVDAVLPPGRPEGLQRGLPQEPRQVRHRGVGPPLPVHHGGVGPSLPVHHGGAGPPLPAHHGGVGPSLPVHHDGVGLLPI